MTRVSFYVEKYKREREREMVGGDQAVHKDKYRHRLILIIVISHFFRKPAEKKGTALRSPPLTSTPARGWRVKPLGRVSDHQNGAGAGAGAGSSSSSAALM